MPEMKVISLGWGVQSFTLAAMVALGELEPIAAAVNSDTLHEAKSTYDFAERWTPWLVAHGVKVITVTPEISDPLNVRGGVGIPAYTVGEGINGMLNRQCTYEWKTKYIRKWMQDNRSGMQIEQWLGISLDEFQRMKDSDVKYIKNRWPLIELKMTRNDCVNWLQKHDLEIPQKSACVFCPYHSQNDWRQIKDEPDDWSKAVQADEAIRDSGKSGTKLYVHRSKKPLSEIDFRTETEKGQLSLWDDECSGICGV